MAVKEQSLLKNQLFSLFWDGLVILCTTFFIIFIPLNVIYKFTLTPLLVVAKLSVTVIFLGDIFITIWRIRNNKNQIGTGLPKTVAEYLRTIFIFDLLAILPFGMFTTALFPGMLRLTKVIKVSRIMHKWRHSSFRWNNGLQLIFTAFWMLLITHWMACGWLALQHIHNETDHFTEYISSLYWTVSTITTVGYGDVAPDTNGERIYSILMMLTGLGFYGYLIGNIAGILSKKDPTHEAYLKNLEMLNVTSKYHKLPHDLHHRIYEYFTYMWNKKRGRFESDFLGRLPEGLSREVSLHFKKDILEKVSLFKKAEPEFIEELALLLRPMVKLPGEVLCKAGESGEEMYFVMRGTLNVVAPDGETLITQLTDGEYFGEIALMSNSRRTATVRAVTFCDLYSLTRDSFNHVLAKHPEIEKEIKAIVEERQKKNNER